LEEAATVLETLAREPAYKSPTVPSYHHGPAGGDERTAFEYIREDRKLVAGSADPGSKGLKGARAKRSVEKNFEDSHISRLKLPGSRMSAGERLKELSKEGK